MAAPSVPPGGTGSGARWRQRRDQASASQEADTEVTNPLLGMGKARSKNGEHRTSCGVNKRSAAPDTKTQQ
jgi:hypothetical protein